MSEIDVRVPRVSKIKVILITFCIVFILGLLAYRISANFNTPSVVAEDLPVNVRIAYAELASIYSTAPITGRIQPIEEVVIIPLATGEVTRVYVSMGDEVTRGTRLFDIDRTQMAATVNQAREGLNSARTHFERMQTLYNEGAVSLQVFEQAQTTYNTTREQFNAASNALSNTTVTSPINGFVTSLSASVGSLASPGVAAATIADVSELKISASVSEFLAPRIKTGDPVDIRIATLGDQVHTGVITAISPAPAVGGLTYPISISVDNEDGHIMAGMFAEINIISDERDMVICVPSDAVIIRAGRAIVVVLNQENIPEFRNVTVGIDNGDFAEITSGLSAGETIVIAGQHFATEGVAVNIVE